jgi:ketosteroid isomerase-like protein
MSQENVEIARQALEGFNRRDIEALVALATPDCEWFPGISGAVGGGVYRGRKGIETWLGEVHDALETQRLRGDEFRDLGDRVLLLGRTEARGRESGVVINAPLGAVFYFRDGKILRIRSFLDHDEASRVAGLDEE